MTEKPSVLFITRKWEPAVGGMETYSHRLTEELGQYANVEVLALPGQKSGMAPTPLQLIAFGLKTSIQLLMRKPTDVVHLGDMAIWPLGLVARLRSRKPVIVISAHGTDVSYPLRGGAKAGLYGIYLKLAAWILPSMKVIANSEATREATSRYGFQDIEIVSLATDMTAHSDSENRAYDRNSLLFAGRLVERKGLSWFVSNVLPLLPVNIKLRVAGTVWDDGEGKSLDDPRVEFLGPLSQAELKKAYRNALSVIVPNVDVSNGEFEGFGLIATEAAAAGGVVVAAFHSGLKEALRDGETGFHVTSGDAEVWKAKLTEIIEWSNSDRASFITASQKSVVTHYSWDRVARETFGHYDLEG